MWRWMLNLLDIPWPAMPHSVQRRVFQLDPAVWQRGETASDPPNDSSDHTRLIRTCSNPALPCPPVAR